MKKIVLLLVSLVVVFGLTACESVCVGPECVVGEQEEGTAVDNAIPFTHINGHGEETDKTAFVLLEYKLRDYVKYQVTYLSCTCRPADFNYWNVAYIEINLFTNDIRYISFDSDGEEGHYHPGTWGDSSGAPEQNGITFENLEEDYFPWYIGKTSEDLEGISLFLNGSYHDLEGNTVQINDVNGDGELLVDAFAGSSVSTNNFLRVVKELLTYHEAKYNE
jgi:hypothetical protein